MASSASASSALVKMAAVVAVCIVLALLSMGPPPVMADVQDECRKDCGPACDGFSAAVCKGVTTRVPEDLKRSVKETCRVRISAQCTNTCVNLCSIDTLPAADTPYLPCSKY